MARRKKPSLKQVKAAIGKLFEPCLKFQQKHNLLTPRNVETKKILRDFQGNFAFLLEENYDRFLRYVSALGYSIEVEDLNEKIILIRTGNLFLRYTI